MSKNPKPPPNFQRLAWRVRRQQWKNGQPTLQVYRDGLWLAVTHNANYVEALGRWLICSARWMRKIDTINKKAKGAG